jgi:hypothetical protein
MLGGPRACSLDQISPPVRYMSLFMTLATTLGCLQIWYRIAAWRRINSNGASQKSSSGIEAERTVDRYGPMWIDPLYSLACPQFEILCQYASARLRDQEYLSPKPEGKAFDNFPTKRTIKPTFITLGQTLGFIRQSLNYYLKTVKAVKSCSERYIPGKTKPASDDVLASFVLNSSIGILSTVEERRCETDGQNGLYVTFDRGGFALPYSFLRFKYDNRLRIQIFIPDTANGDDHRAMHSNRLSDQERLAFRSPTCHANLSNSKGSRILEFKLGDSERFGSECEVSDPEDRFHILVVFLAIVTHPLIHSFSDGYIQKLYSLALTDQLPRAFHIIFAYGNAFNDLASLPGVPLSGRLDHWITIMQDHNSRLPMTLGKDHAKSVRILSQYSRVYHFLHESHSALAKAWSIFKVRKDEKLQLMVPDTGGLLDLEAFFLGSICHSIDHFAVGKFLRGYNVKGGRRFNEGYQNLVSDIFYQSTDPQLFGSARLEDHAANHPFFQDLYQRLREIDAQLAHFVSLGIAE